MERLTRGVKSKSIDQLPVTMDVLDNDSLITFNNARPANYYTASSVIQ